MLVSLGWRDGWVHSPVTRAVHTALPCFFVSVLACAWNAGAHADGVRVDVVEKKYRRCGRHLERVSEQLEQLDERVEALSELVVNAEVRRADKTPTLLRTTRTKLTRLRSRFDRAQSQSNRIAGEINRYKGSRQGCPDCLLSDVTMLCRHAESMLAETADLLRTVHRCENGIRRRENARTHIRRTDTLIAAAQEESTAEGMDLQRARTLQQQAHAAYNEKDFRRALEHTIKARDALGAQAADNGTEGNLSRRARALTDRIEAVRAVIDKEDEPEATVVTDKALKHVAAARELIAEGRAKKAAAELTVAERFVGIAEGKVKRE